MAKTQKLLLRKVSVHRRKKKTLLDNGRKTDLMKLWKVFDIFFSVPFVRPARLREILESLERKNELVRQNYMIVCSGTKFPKTVCTN